MLIYHLLGIIEGLNAYLGFLDSRTTTSILAQ